LKNGWENLLARKVDQKTEEEDEKDGQVHPLRGKSDFD